MLNFRLACWQVSTMEALQRLHMSPVGSPFGMNHHESPILRANANVEDRKSPMDTRLIMHVSINQLSKIRKKRYINKFPSKLTTKLIIRISLNYIFCLLIEIQISTNVPCTTNWYWMLTIQWIDARIYIKEL